MNMACGVVGQQFYEWIYSAGGTMVVLPDAYADIKEEFSRICCIYRMDARND